MHVNPEKEIVTTIVLRQPEKAAAIGQQLLAGQFEGMGRAEAERALAADPKDMAAVRQFAEAHGLRVVSENAAGRSVRVEGTIRQMETLFSVSMHQRRDGCGCEYLSYDGDIVVPQPLDGIVVAVLGLDRRPVARRHPTQLSGAERAGELERSGSGGQSVPSGGVPGKIG